MPKRSPEVLRALASDPVGGWVQTPLVNKSDDVEALNAPYLVAFLKHHELPASKEAMDGLFWKKLTLKLIMEHDETLHGEHLMQHDYRAFVFF